MRALSSQQKTKGELLGSKCRGSRNPYFTIKMTCNLNMNGLASSRGEENVNRISSIVGHGTP